MTEPAARKPMSVSRDRTVYSSQHGRTCPHCGRPVKECVCRANPRGAARAGDGIVRVKREIAGRRGKPSRRSTACRSDDALRELAGELKRRCGSGGTAKDGVIEIQGDHRDVVIEELEAKGYTVKRAGGSSAHLIPARANRRRRPGVAGDVGRRVAARNTAAPLTSSSPPARAAGLIEEARHFSSSPRT